MTVIFLSILDKAAELASKVGGQALTLAELNDFHPEEGMILVNTTSVGMKPQIDETPISKVCLFNLAVKHISHEYLAKRY